MTIVALNRLAWVIMYEFQKRNGNDLLSFSTLYAICNNAAFKPLPDGKRMVDPESPQKVFHRLFFEELNWLGNHGYVAVHTIPNEDKILHIRLLPKGREYIKETTFSNQEITR